MYSSILVVGGGLMFHGAQEFLLHGLSAKMPPHSTGRLVNNVEVIPTTKGHGPTSLISWKGAVLVLDTTRRCGSTTGWQLIWCQNAREGCLSLVKPN
ncbi:actin-related protein 8 [Lates japonicus]|uniref:Actin-related protein 8 n=1 Tax=Lates japonicus TaxID=270547 RepID=A0AAD3M219_LATJO|nr:actin-related protein 8 [Lates japonicus]